MKVLRDPFQKLIDQGKIPSQIAKKTYSTYEVDPYNATQNFLYKKALYGLKVYSDEQIAAMKKEEIIEIKKLHKKAQEILNQLKQVRLIEITNDLLSCFGKGYGIGKDLLSEIETDSDFFCTLSLKDLKITKDEVINYFIRFGVLPENFLSLSCEENFSKTK